MEVATLSLILAANSKFFLALLGRSPDQQSKSAISFWLSTQDFLLEELLKEAWTYTVANPWEVIECDELRHKPAHHLATIIGFDQTTSKEVQMILK